MKSFKVPTNQKCFHCTAGCCSDVVIELDYPDEFEDFDNIRWYLYHNNVFVYIEEEDGEDAWHVGFKTLCGALNEDYSCGVYAKRPEICREHSPKDCSEYTGPGAEGPRSDYYDAYFSTAEELDAWLIENELPEMVRPEDEKKEVVFESRVVKKKKKIKG